MCGGPLCLIGSIDRLVDYFLFTTPPSLLLLPPPSIQHKPPTPTPQNNCLGFLFFALPQVRIWDYQTKACVQVLEGHSHNVSSVLFHPRLPILISGSEDGTVSVLKRFFYVCMRCCLPRCVDTSTHTYTPDSTYQPPISIQPPNSHLPDQPSQTTSPPYMPYMT